MAQTEELMFQNVAYRPTVCKTGVLCVKGPCVKGHPLCPEVPTLKFRGTKAICVNRSPSIQLFGHLHFTKNQAVCSRFGSPISNHPTCQSYQLFNLKIQIYFTRFPSIFCRSCQIQCFLHTVDAIPKRLKYLS